MTVAEGGERKGKRIAACKLVGGIVALLTVMLVICACMGHSLYRSRTDGKVLLSC